MTEKKLNFDDVNSGDVAPEKSVELTRTDLVKYAGASGDFNPMHHDEIKAQAAGMPSVFGHGMFSMGFLATALEEWVGIGNLRSFSSRFTKQTWPGDTLTTQITVSDKRKENGDQILVLEVALLNQKGEAVISGTATAAI